MMKLAFWNPDACLSFETDYKCTSCLGSCSEGMWASLSCILASQDSIHHTRLCTWWEASVLTLSLL